MLIDIVETEPCVAAVVRGRWPLSDMRRAQHDARAALDTALAGQERSCGPRLTVWRMPEGGMIDYAPGIVVAAGVVVAAPATLWTVPRGRAAHVRHVGGYEGLPAAWQGLFSACSAQGLEPVGPNWEIYRDTDGEAPATDLYALLSG